MSRPSSYQAGDFCDIEVIVRRAAPIGNHHVPSLSISADAEWKDPDPSVSLKELAEQFDLEASHIAEALIQCLPGGTLDRLVGKLLAYKATHFLVNHETPRRTSSTGARS